MKENFISVIIPVYNAEPYLKRCIESVINQTHASLEIILVDDASTDSSREICQSYANKDNRIQLIFQEKNQGQSVARNCGLDICTGEFIGFVDADDYIEKDFYEVLLSSIRKDDLDIIECGCRVLTLEGKVKEETVPTDFITEGSRENLEKYILESYGSSPCRKLYRRKIFADLRFEEGRIYEDAILLLRAFCIAGRCGSITYRGYNLILSPGSIIRSGYSLKRLDKIYMCEDRYLFCREHMEHLADYSLYGICFFIVANHYRLRRSKIEQRRSIMEDLIKKYKCYYPKLRQSVQIKKVSIPRRILLKLFNFQPYVADYLLELVGAVTGNRFKF